MRGTGAEEMKFDKDAQQLPDLEGRGFLEPGAESQFMLCQIAFASGICRDGAGAELLS